MAVLCFLPLLRTQEPCLGKGSKTPAFTGVTKGLLVFFLWLYSFPATAETRLPRTVIALYDDRGGGIQTSYIHTMAEMPLNHLGLTLEYHDIHDPLPDIAEREDVRGVLVWLFADTRVAKPAEFLEWATRSADAGKKLVVMSTLGIKDDLGRTVSLQRRLFDKLGITLMEKWVQHPLNAVYTTQTPGILLTSNPFEWTRPAYQVVRIQEGKAQPHFSAHHEGAAEEDADLLITGPGGGYAAGNYIFRINERNDEEVKQWLIDPFAFFRLAFATDDLPKPDTTTIAGRRIFYSHIDGDGWNNMTQIEEYKEKPVLSARVIMDKVIKPHPELPVTLTVIAGDVDPHWAAVEDSRAAAKEFYALPQVEAGSHTYSHPFYWQFFKDGDAKQEIPYLSHYAQATWKPLAKDAAKVSKAAYLPSGYVVPRAYAYEPFNITKEIDGSLAELMPLLPEGKTLAVLTWSGNCSPWEAAVRMVREKNLRNINGGDSRLDPDYPNYASLAPIGRTVGAEQQVYASTSNENTYTSLWSKDYHAFGYLQQTLRRSESPVRLKPLNIYYHIYSGERDASLAALLSNIAYAESQDIAPVTASRYTRIADGFYTTQLVQLAPDTWRVEGRGELQTIRFDRHSFDAVDFTRSKGVIGQRQFQGSLYVYLDASVPQPVIALKETDAYFAPPQEAQPYLVESRWLISNLKRQEGKLEFSAQGYGEGEMVWQVPGSGKYRVSVGGKSVQEVTAQQGGELRVLLKQSALQPLHVTIAPAKGGRSA